MMNLMHRKHIFPKFQLIFQIYRFQSPKGKKKEKKNRNNRLNCMNSIHRREFIQTIVIFETRPFGDQMTSIIP